MNNQISHFKYVPSQHIQGLECASMAILFALFLYALSGHKPLVAAIVLVCYPSLIVFLICWKVVDHKLKLNQFLNQNGGSHETFTL